MTTKRVNDVKCMLMAKLSSSVRNSGNNWWIASKLNDVLRRDGDYEGVKKADVVAAMDIMTFEERMAPLTGAKK